MRGGLWGAGDIVFFLRGDYSPDLLSGSEKDEKDIVSSAERRGTVLQGVLTFKLRVPTKRSGAVQQRPRDRRRRTLPAAGRQAQA
jgi:hypothetical protein